MPFIFHESFRFLIGKWMMPPNKNRKWKVDPYQRYLTPLEFRMFEKKQNGNGSQEEGNEKGKNLSKAKHDANTKLLKSFEQMVGYDSISMKPECNVCTLNLLCSSHRFGSAFGYRYSREHSASSNLNKQCKFFD